MPPLDGIPEIVVAPDLADDGAAVLELALSLKWLGKGMLNAHEGRRDPYEVRREVLKALKQHLISVAHFIGEMERRADG